MYYKHECQLNKHPNDCFCSQYTSRVHYGQQKIDNRIDVPVGSSKELRSNEIDRDPWDSLHQISYLDIPSKVYDIGLKREKWMDLGFDHVKIQYQQINKIFDFRLSYIVFI